MLRYTNGTDFRIRKMQLSKKQTALILKPGNFWPLQDILFMFKASWGSTLFL